MSRNKVDTVVGFVLDESGSMEGVRESTVSGFNEYLSSLKKDETPTLLSLWSFNSGGVKVSR